MTVPEDKSPPHARKPQHVLEMNIAHRRFTGDEHQLTSLFQNHIDGAVHEVLRQTVR